MTESNIVIWKILIMNAMYMVQHAFIHTLNFNLD